MGLNEFGARPGRVAARLAKLVERSVAEADLSLPQYRLLAFLSEASVAASALADKLAVSPPSVTALVDGLVARGLVERRPDPVDRRRVTHVLTEQGQATLDTADGAVAAALARLVELMPAGRRRRAVEGLELWGDALDAARTTRRLASRVVRQ